MDIGLVDLSEVNISQMTTDSDFKEAARKLVDGFEIKIKEEAKKLGDSLQGIGVGNFEYDKFVNETTKELKAEFVKGMVERLKQLKNK